MTRVHFPRYKILEHASMPPEAERYLLRLGDSISAAVLLFIT
jgi:hypothetical protein